MKQKLRSKAQAGVINSAYQSRPASLSLTPHLGVFGISQGISRRHAFKQYPVQAAAFAASSQIPLLRQARG